MCGEGLEPLEEKLDNLNSLNTKTNICEYFIRSQPMHTICQINLKTNFLVLHNQGCNLETGLILETGKPWSRSWPSGLEKVSVTVNKARTETRSPEIKSKTTVFRS